MTPINFAYDVTYIRDALNIADKIKWKSIQEKELFVNAYVYRRAKPIHTSTNKRMRFKVQYGQNGVPLVLDGKVVRSYTTSYNRRKRG